jgi:hypothetical protein
VSDATYYTEGIVEETTFGVVPASALQLINVTSFPLTRPRSMGRPNVHTGNRRRYPERILQEDGNLSVPAPIQYANLRLLREGLMANDIATIATITDTDISVVGSTGVIASVAGDMSDFAVGDHVYVSGASVAANNGWKGPVTAADASSITVPAAQVSDESATASITISTTRHTDAEVEKSYTAEWRDTKLTNKFRSASGLSVGQGVYDWAQGAFATETYTLIGKAPVKGSATVGTGAALAAPTSGFMNAVQDFGEIWIGTAAATSYVISKLTLTVTNGQNAIRGLGSLGPSAIPLGPMDLELRATVLYDDNSDTLFGQMEDHATIDVAWDIVDPQGNRERHYLPAMKAGGDGPAPGEAGSQTEFELMATGHDPARDADSPYVAAGFGYQYAQFSVPAV